MALLWQIDAANRSLEDIDAYYRSSPTLFVTKDPDAICRERLEKYVVRENETIKSTVESKEVLSGVAAGHIERVNEEEA